MAHVNKQMISFFLTTSCNLRCSYCYTGKDESGRSGQRIDLGFAKVGIDDYFRKSSNRHIRFFGAGEPTVELNLMQRILNYARETGGRSVTAEIQTNGVFNVRIADWLADNIDIIWVSSDGPPDIQDRYRRTSNGKPTSKLLAKNVKYLVNHCKGMTGIRSTITGETIDRQKEIVDYFSSLGVKYIWSDPLFPTVGERSEYLTFDFHLYVEHFLEAMSYAKSMEVFYGSFLACNFDSESDCNCRACTPTPHLTTDGFVSACDMALFGRLLPRERHMEPFIYGKWNPEQKQIDYFEDRIKLLRSRKAENMPGCKECPVLKHCAGYCLGEVANESGSMFGKKTAACEAIVALHARLGDSTIKYKYFHP